MSEHTFYSATGVRPVRLCPATRDLARRSLLGEFGRSMSDIELKLEEIDGFEFLDDFDRYVEAIRLIASTAPIRTMPGEKLAGSASLSAARKLFPSPYYHIVPAFFHGQPLFGSVSHVTCGFGEVLEIGFQGLEKIIIERKSEAGLDEKGKKFLDALLSCLEAYKIWHKRIRDSIYQLRESKSGKEYDEYTSILENLENVPAKPPESFREAIQSLWLMFCFLRLCGNWPGIGRIDVILGKYLQSDLSKGRI
ncbi:MAG TPA: hypothetical protein DD727_10035, partial [Clostridiales bacterium]|nr:hypothetical protein [Clostridiales bacterium]